jgi:hypothetical protein
VATFFFCLTVILLAAIPILISAGNKAAKQLEKTVRAALAALTDFTPSKVQVVAYGGLTNGIVGLALDETRQQLALVVGGLKQARAEVINGQQLVSAALIEDGATITQTQRNWGLTRAAGLGLLLGGAGAVVGAVTASQTSTTTTPMDSLTLRLVVDDIKAPVREVTFWKHNPLIAKQSKDSPLYKAAAQLAREWETIASILIRRAEHGQLAQAGAEKAG